jgi:hypothetical protein
VDPEKSIVYFLFFTLPSQNSIQIVNGAREIKGKAGPLENHFSL